MFARGLGTCYTEKVLKTSCNSGIFRGGNCSMASGRIKKTAFTFSFLYSLALVLGFIMYDTNSLRGGFKSAKSCIITIGSIVILTLALGFIMLFLLQFIAKRGDSAAAPGEGRLYRFFTGRGAYFYIWAIIFCSFLPCYLAYYPGVFSYDIITQTAMIMGDIPYSTAVPPLHTFLWIICVQIQEKLHTNNAIVFYSIFQMLIFSAMLAKVPSFICKKTASGGWGLIALLFFILNPVISIMSFSTTKAVLFAGAFILLALELWELIAETDAYLNSRRCRIRFILITLLACLLRGNAFFCILLMIPFALKALQDKKRAAEIFALPVVLYLLINNVIYPAIGFESGSSSELIVVPMQQIACVIDRHADEIPEEEIAQLDVYYGDAIPAAENYNPRFADPVKNSFHVSGSELVNFIKLWVKLGVRYPADYLDAFLTLNLPYWYQGADAVDSFAQRQYIETSLGGDKHFGGYGYYWFFRDSKLPGLFNFYESAADYSLFRNVPIISRIFSLSFPLWLTLFCMAVLKARDKAKARLVLLPALLQWAIFMFGPVSNFRYIFPIFLSYPVYAALSFAYNGISAKKSKNS